MELLQQWYSFLNQILNILGVADDEDESNWIKYMLPGTGNKHRVCRNALCGILNIRYAKWRHVVKNDHSPHKLKGRKGNDSCKGKGNVEIYNSLHEFFNELKDEASPFATRVICEETGTTTRDDDPDEVSLPPSYSKHRVYAMWCWKRG